MKTALITGITGQDGAYLSKFLIEKGYKVFGTYRRLSTPNFWRLQYLDLVDKICFIPMDLSDSGSILESLKIAQPDEIYHLAAQSFVGSSFETPVATGDITGLSTTRFLECIRSDSPESKFYFASTSEMFGDEYSLNKNVILNENSIFRPMSPYASAKLYGYWVTNIYRRSYNLFTVNGILFNHESPLRGLEFVTRKIANEVAKIRFEISNELRLGNIEARRDWGYAPEYVEAMWKMLQSDVAEDFVIATKECHSVKEFLNHAFNYVKLNWEDYVKIDKRYLRPLDIPALIGDYQKAEKKLGWTPKTRFKELVELMVNEEIKRWERWNNGDSFPWDAPLYPSELKVITRSKRS